MVKHNAIVFVFVLIAAPCSCVRTPVVVENSSHNRSLEEERVERQPGFMQPYKSSYPYNLHPYFNHFGLGRHGWRGNPLGLETETREKTTARVETPHSHPTAPSAEQSSTLQDGARPKDWCFLVFVVLVGVTALHALAGERSSNSLNLKALVFWLLLASAYLIVVYRRQGKDSAWMWATGYMLEVENMIENIFIFNSVARSLKVPNSQCRRVMLVVMFTQIIFATVCYMGLADVLRHIKVLPYFLGIWLIYTASALAYSNDKDEFDTSSSSFGRCLQWCLGDRFWPAYDDSNLFLYRQDIDKTVMSLLGYAVFTMASMDCLLEMDVTLTKIEQFPSTYINYSSTVMASVMIPDVFHFAGRLFQRFWTLKYGIAGITLYFGIQFILIDVIIVPAAINCLVMVITVATCIVLAPMLQDSDDQEAVCRLDSASQSEPEMPPPQEGD